MSNKIMDNQIKIDNQHPSPPKKRTKQKSKQDIFLHLLQMYQPSPRQIPATQVPHEIQDLHELLSQPPKSRSTRLLKKLKSILSQLPCFKTPPLLNPNPQFLQIFKRDNTNILNMIAPFVQLTRYGKGCIVQATAMKRNAIRVLLVGEVGGFQPINYGAWKNCLKRVGKGEISGVAVAGCQGAFEEMLYGYGGRKESSVIFEANQQYVQTEKSSKKEQNGPKRKVDEQKSQQNTRTKNTTITQPNPQSQLPQPNPHPHSSPLTLPQLRELLTKTSLITPLSPHKQSKRPKPGNFLFDKDQPMFIDQRPEYYTCFVCATDCVFLEVGYEIAREVIVLINSDRERPFIQALLFKFPMLKYFQAKQYVTQDYMISNQVQEEDGTKITKRSAIQIIKQLKVINSQNFQLLYTGQLYLIISGTVTLLIDQISQRKPSTLQQYIIPQKSIINKEILYLYKNDIFGFEEIGKERGCNLRYRVEIGAKLLKIDGGVLRMQMGGVRGFREEVEDVTRVRNQVIREILGKMESSLEHQEIQRHESITYSKSQLNLTKLRPSKSMQLTQNQNQIKQLKYYGHQDYNKASSRIRQHFSPQNTDKPKQALSPEIVNQNGLGLEFAKNLLKKPDEKIEIKDGWIEIRNGKGVLLRRKRVKRVEEDGLEERGDALLRKLGILTSKEIAEHNFRMVTNRPSKYEFDDLKKEAKEFKKIRDQESSLPKLTKFFAKKQDRLFTILYKRTHM